MERRKLLLGSAGALATVLAGCTGGGGGENDDGGDDGKGGDDADDGGNNDADVPGLDTSEIDLDGHDVAVEVGGEDDEELHIEVSAPEDDADAEQLLEELAGALANSMDNKEKFMRKIETIYVTVVDDGEDPVVAFYVDVEWAIEYIEGNLSDEEFAELIEETDS